MLNSCVCFSMAVRTGMVTPSTMTSVWPDTGATIGPEDLFSCAFTLRNVPCETVKELGDDIGAWLNLDPGCSWVAEPKGAGASR